MKFFALRLSAFALILTGAAAAQTTQSACSGMALGTNGALNGFVPTGTDAWHTDVTNAAVDPSSSTILVSNGNDLAGAFLHPDFGQGAGIPYNVVDSSQTAGVPVGINLYAADSDITLAPVPSNAVIEGNPNACPTDTNDRHMIVVDRNKCVVYEYWQAGQCNGNFSASNTALFDMVNGEQRPYGITSADAAGLSIFAGLVRYDEIIAGSINHAIRFTASHTKNNANNGIFVAPATHASGNNWSTDNIIGMRIRLRADFDISGYSATNQIILKAMKKYGMILADNGSSMFFQGTTDSRWNDDDLSKLKSIPSSAFDVVQMGTKYDANTAPTGTAPVISSLTASATTVAPGTAVTLTPNVTGSTYNYIDNAGFVRGTSVTVTPKATTTYTLTSRNAYGTSTKSVTVTVSSGFTAAPSVTSPTTTTTKKTLLSLGLVKLSATHYQVVAYSNSIAPVAIMLTSGTGTLSGSTLTMSSTGTVTLQAKQLAVTGYTTASVIAQFVISSLQ